MYTSNPVSFFLLFFLQPALLRYTKHRKFSAVVYSPLIILSLFTLQAVWLTMAPFAMSLALAMPLICFTVQRTCRARQLQMVVGHLGSIYSATEAEKGNFSTSIAVCAHCLYSKHACIVSEHVMLSHCASLTHSSIVCAK